MLAGIALVTALTVGLHAHLAVAARSAAPGGAPSAYLTLLDAAGTSAPASPTATAGAGTPPGIAYAGSIGLAGVSPIIWYGGSASTVTALAATVQRAGAASATVFRGGTPYVLIPGAPDVANARFRSLFPAGAIPSGTIVLVTSGLPLNQAKVVAAAIARGMSASPVTFLSADSGRLGQLFPGSLPSDAGRVVWSIRFSGTFPGPGGPAQTVPGASSTATPPNQSMSVVLDQMTGALVFTQSTSSATP